VRDLRPALLHAIGQATRVAPALRFRRQARDPRAAQEALLSSLLTANAATDYGRRHGFTSIRNYADFAARVPFMTAADLAPLVDRQMRGERAVLTAEAPVYYVRTTGSTGEAKHVPITATYRAEFQQTVHVSLFHLYRRFPSAFTGRALYFVGSRRVARADDGCDVGTMSGFNFTELPPLLRAIYAWPYELFEVADLPTRSFLALLLAVTRDVSLVAGIFPAPIVYLLRELETRADELAHTVERGRLPESLRLSDDERAFFQAGLRADPAVARRLRDAARAPEGERVARALPHLRLVYCWTTSTAALYLPELARRLGPTVAIRDAIYSACEGWCSIPMGEAEPGGAAAIGSHLLEFIPEEDYAAGRYEAARPVWALDDGRRYAIVMTTGAGLYRYLLHDLVEVCGLYERTPRIRFVRKACDSSNLAGEKLDESHATRAVGAALAAAGLEATWFALVARPPGPGRDKPGYALHLELPAGVTLPAEALVTAVDRALGAEAFDYGRLRAGHQLAPLTLVRVAPGGYDRVRQEKVAAGAAEAQLKVAHLIADAASLPAPLRGEDN